MMETMQELIPFAREMLSQKPNRKMVKLYVVGSVLAFFGVVIGLMETVCQPFTSQENPEDEEEAEKIPQKPELQSVQKEETVGKVSEHKLAGRNSANRLHAS